MKLCLWTRPLDWRQPDEAATVGQYLSFAGPDAESEVMEVSAGWKRVKFTFVVEHLVSQGVVDLVVGGERQGRVWVDAVQLEEGPQASAFGTRYPVEVVLAGRRKPLMVHPVDQPLELVLASYNSSGSVRSEEMRLKIETLKGAGVLEKRLQEPVPAGYRERKLSYPFERVGEFRAQVRSGSEEPIGLEDYPVRGPSGHAPGSSGRDLFPPGDASTSFPRRGSGFPGRTMKTSLPTLKPT